MIEAFVLIMGALIGANATGRQQTVAERERQLAWTTFLTTVYTQEGRDPAVVERELVHFDRMQEQGLMPPGYRRSQDVQQPGAEPRVLPAGFVEISMGVHRESQIRQIFDPNVIVVDDANEFATIRKLYGDAHQTNDISQPWGERTHSPHPFRILMHSNPNPSNPPHGNMAIAPLDRFISGRNWFLPDVGRLESAGVYPAKWMADPTYPLGVIPQWNRRIMGTLPGVYWNNTRFFREMVQSVISALRAGFILAHSPSYPNGFVVLHPWPEDLDWREGAGPWGMREIQVEEGEAEAGILFMPMDHAQRDAAARENFHSDFTGRNH